MSRLFKNIKCVPTVFTALQIEGVQTVYKPLKVSRLYKKTLKVSRLYKKCSTDGELTIFLPKRELKMDGETCRIDNLEGVVIISEKLAAQPNMKVFVHVI